MTEIRSIGDKVVDLVREALAAEFDTPVDAPIKLDQPPKPEQGDFALACFPFAKALKSAPPKIAQALAPRLEADDLVEKAQAAGPYLNLFIHKPALARFTLGRLFADPDGYHRWDLGADEKVLVEYSAPNTNKPQHLGHVRNNVLGISLTRILAAVGHEVVPVNLVNDRGVHICKSMLAYERFGEGATPASTGRKGDHLVGDFYVRYAQAESNERKAWREARGEDLPEDPKAAEAAYLAESKLNAEIQEMLRRWEAGDEAVRTLWSTMNGWVFDGFRETYDRLGCRFEKVYLESDTYTLGKALVEEGLEKGVFFKKDDGSVWIDLTDRKLDEKLVLRNDGTSVYITQDLGTSKLKYDDFGFHRAVWIVGDEQIYHFQVLFAILEALGFSWAKGCHHLAYGMVDLPEGKMKSRTGTVVDADDLMDELKAMEIAEIESRDLGLTGEDLDRTAEILAQGALKFFILKFAPKTRMTFDPKESISPEGFTGPYVQYACVRIRSIFRKAGLDPARPAAGDDDLSLLALPEEVAVIRRIHDFPGEVRSAAEQMNPARLASYLFELARDYSRFYHNLPVLKAEEEGLKRARLALCQAVGIVLEKGLSLLGIETPEMM